MIWNNLAFYHVLDMAPAGAGGGMLLHRLPENVREGMDPGGKAKARESSGSEIRFVTDAEKITLRLSVESGVGHVAVYQGDFFHSAHRLTSNHIESIEFIPQPRFKEVPVERLTRGVFAPQVWRIVFDRVVAVFHELDTHGVAVRPPLQEELPSLTLAAYGSSITQGVGAVHHPNAYVHQAARRLGVDVLNLGMSGACHCERSFADHLAGRGDWDAVFLELGVNMRAVFTPAQFEERAGYLLEQTVLHNPGKRVVLTTIYPNRATYFLDQSKQIAVDEPIFNDILRRLAGSYGEGRIQVVEGRDILTEFTSLTSDLIHPADIGHVLMGEKLAALLEPTISSLRSR